MKKVIHYKTNFLNKTETFIERLIHNHNRYYPVALCYRKRSFANNVQVFSVPKKGLEALINIISYRLTLPLPYYYRAISKEKPQIVHAHFGFDGPKILWFANRFNIPLVTSFYGSDVSYYPKWIIWRYRYRKLAKRGSHFIAATDFMKSQLIELGFPKSKISVVHFGVDFTKTPFSKAPKNGTSFMMVGRMIEKKGFEFAIRAVSILKKRGLTIQLHIYGDGPLMKQLQQLRSELNVLDIVHFHGFKPIEDILKAHSNHSVLLAPSVTAKNRDMEGLPNTILEAMAMGTPVIATRHAAIPEVISDKETGFLVNERDPAALADVIQDICNGKYCLESVRKKARSLVEKEYSVKKMVSEIEKIYDTLLQN